MLPSKCRPTTAVTPRFHEFPALKFSGGPEALRTAHRIGLENNR